MMMVMMMMINIYWVLTLCQTLVRVLPIKSLQYSLQMKNKAQRCPVIWTSNIDCKWQSQDLTPDPALLTTTHKD